MNWKRRASAAITIMIMTTITIMTSTELGALAQLL
jgi:hypothetical protein